MNALARNARWLAGGAGLLLAVGIASAAPAVPKAGAYKPAGSASLVYTVYLQGTPTSRGPAALAADGLGRAYAGSMSRHPETLPGIPIPGAPLGPPYGPYPNPYMDGDAFVLGYGPAGQGFFRVFVAGPALDVVQALAVDSSSVYVAREAMDTDGSWVYVDKLDASSIRSALYSTWILGGHWATVNDIAVDRSGNAYITGRTGNRSYDNYTNFYFEAAYIAKLDPHGAVQYLRELDGHGYDEGLRIDVDADGNAYASGITRSPDFPVAGDPSGSPCGTDQFVAKIDPYGQVVYSRCYAGGRILEIAAAQNGDLYLAKATPGSSPETLEAFVRLDAEGFLADIIYVGETGIASLAGFAFGPHGTFYVAGLGRPDLLGCGDTALARLNSGTGVSTAICLPGVTVRGLAIDPAGNAYVTGQVSSAGLFPATGIGRPFLAKIAFNRPPDCSAAFAGPATIWPPDGRLVPVAIRNVIDPDGDPVTLTITGVRQDEPLGGSPNAFGIGTPGVSLRADRDGKGDGRVYRLRFTATDPQGASCTGTATVCVPHDQGQGRTCGDGGGSFNSGG